MTNKTTAKKAEPKLDAKAGIEDVAAFGQQNVDAFVKASEVAAKTVEDLAGEATTYSKKSFEDMVAVAQDIATANTAAEVLEKQSAYAKSAFEGFMAQASKMNDMYAAAAKDLGAPLNERMTAFGMTMKPFAA